MYVDVAEIFAGGVKAPEPNILPFINDSHLFYTGEFNLVFGDPESGKTWLCLAAVASTIDGRAGSATVIDLDHNGARSLLNRLEMLGATREELSDRQCFRLAAPESATDLRELVEDLREFKPDVVVLDSLGEVMPLFGANSNSADDFTVVHTEVIKPLARAGAAVLVVDHLPKNAESRKHGPTGTGAKMRTVGGAAVRVSAEKAFRLGVGGSAVLELHKDRHGGVRRLATDGSARPVIGTFVLAEDENNLTYSFQSPLAVPPTKRTAIDSDQAKADAEKLLELHRGGHRVNTVRAAKSALASSQIRAESALIVFRDALASSVEPAA